ncbi:MAG: hypothetical protein KGH58_01910 [Candidatus Micrarchaeota archaeon]|nr:hypothetical protein [Candidatus Micrarchaeota archaeon]
MVALGTGLAHAQLLPTPKGLPLNISLSNTYISVQAGSACSGGACAEPQRAGIEACAYGGKGPYLIVVYNNNQQVATASTPGCYYYTFTPPSVGTYGIRFSVADSSSPPQNASASATIAATPQSSTGPLSSSISLSKADVNVSQSVLIGLTISGGSAPYSVRAYVNGGLSEASTTYSPYTYSFTPSAEGAYSIRFLISDSAGRTTNQSATVYAVPGGYISSSKPGSNPLSITVSPKFQTVQPGVPVRITAKASGGNSALYNILLYDGSGTQLVVSQKNSVNYTFTPYQAGIYYLFTAVVYDASHNVSSQGIDILTANVTPTNGTLSETITPDGQSVNITQQATFNITPSGGTGPYYLVIRDQYGNLIKSARLNSTKPYSFRPLVATAGTYQFGFTLSNAYGALVSKTATLTVTGSTVSSVQYAKGTLNAVAGQQVDVRVSPHTMACPCTVLVYNNGAYQQRGTVTAGGTYTYSFVPPTPGIYSISFITQYQGSGADGYSETLLDQVYVSSQAQASPQGNNLSVSISPQSTTYAPPAASVQITATASGGDSSLYNIILFDGSGNELAVSDSNHLSYTYIVPSPGSTYYPLTAVVYDASHATASSSTYVYAT